MAHENLGVRKVIGNVIRRKRGKQRGPKWGKTKQTKTKKLPPTLCGICNINLNYVNSVQCQECKKYVHLKKCSGLDSEKQYKPDYKCPRCIEAEAVAYGADDEEDELKNGPDKQPESEKTTGRKRKTMEKEELPEKLSPKRKMNKIEDKNKIEEKGTPEIKTTGGEETKKIKVKAKSMSQVSETLTTIDGIKITKADRISIENRKKVTCTIISLFIKKLESSNKDALENNKILMIEPAIVQLLQLQEKKYVKEQKEHLNMTNYDWILFPISNRKNPDEGDGGEHFSLAIFNKKEHRFLHFDPVNGCNRRNALDLMTNLIDSECVIEEDNVYKLPDFEEVECEKQQNGFDCGPFVMGYMAEAIELIKDECVPWNLSAPPFGALEMRNRLAKFIDGNINKNPKSKERSDPKNDKTEEKDSIEIIEIINDKISKPIEEKRGNSVERKNNKNKNTDKDKEQNIKDALKILNEILDGDGDSDKQKPNKNESIGNGGSKDTSKNKEQIDKSNNNKKKQEETKLMNDNNNKDARGRENRNVSSKNRGRGCRYYVNDSCRYGRQCRYPHIEVCSGWKRNGNCGNRKCTFDHPEPCIEHLKGTCRRGSCWFLHTLEVADTGRDMHQEMPTLMQKQKKHDEVGWKQNHKQNFWNGLNRRQEIQKKKIPEEEKIITQQQSIHLMMEQWRP